MAELANIAAEISKGKNLESNLSKYAGGLDSLYCRFGYIKLALNLYTFAQVYGENDEFSNAVKEYVSLLSSCVKEGIVSNDNTNLSYVEKNLNNLRNQIIAQMEVLTSYADRLQIYEYVLNRIEYNFNEPDVNMDYYGEKFEKDILNYIVSENDNSIINIKISQVVGQLPMRLSKNKFFELLHNAFTVYKGADKKSVDDFVYMLRSVSMLYKPDNFDTAFPDLKNLLDKLNAYDYTNINEDGFNEALAVFTEASEYVTGITDIYVLLMETINDCYTIVLSKKNSIYDTLEKDRCVKIINHAVESLDGALLPIEDNYDDFAAIEGIQEKLYTMLSRETYALDDIKNSLMDKVEEFSLTEAYSDLFKLELLTSGSNFMSLDSNEVSESSTEEYIDEQYENIFNELSELFRTGNRLFNRAIMAGILSTLPVFFNNIDEIKSYIHVSLGQCKDEAEMAACMKLILSLINE